MTELTIRCPHCNYLYCDNDMYCTDGDMYALAPEGSNAEIQCVKCDKRFWVQGSYIPQYETFKTYEELE